jgi:hypothetical protein
MSFFLHSATMRQGGLYSSTDDTLAGLKVCSIATAHKCFSDSPRRRFVQINTLRFIESAVVTDPELLVSQEVEGCGGNGQAND